MALRSRPSNFLQKMSVAPTLFFAVLIALVVPPTMSADLMTLEDLALMKYVNEVTVSPDGNTFAYTLRVQRNPFQEKDGSAWLELHVADRTGRSRPFVTGHVKVSRIGWTPDGKHITYLAERGEDTVKSIYTIPLDGGESRKITDNCQTIKEYTWASDGRYIAFLARDTLATAVSKLRKKGFNQEVYEEDWRQVQVWIHDTESEKYEPRPIGLDGTASNISWSPDGKLIAMALVPTPLIDDRYMARKVCLVDPGDGTVAKKYDNPGKLGDFAWSPDSKHLAFISGADINDPSAGEIHAVAADGDMFPVLANFDGHVREIAWLDNN
ncbi:MAG: PD40 domain-containing protein, partial [Candidatus Zixiibacteriota bacterium]